MAYGDSKSSGFAAELTDLLQAELPLSMWLKNDPLTIGGVSTEQLYARVDSDLAARPSSPEYLWVLLTLGTNDVPVLPAEAAWKTATAGILDAIHAKWPNARVGLARPWKRDATAECNTLAGWQDDVMASRPWSFHGPDERIYLENGDDGATYTTDGTHPTLAGYTLAAQKWLEAMGY